MNANPQQLPLMPPEGLEVVNPHNLEKNKYYIVHFVEILDGEIVPDEGRPHWDLVYVTDVSQESIEYDRIKTFLTHVGPEGNDVMWYTLNTDDDENEEIEKELPYEALVESIDGLNDGQYFIFHKLAQAGGRRRRSRHRRMHRRRRATRRHRRT